MEALVLIIAIAIPVLLIVISGKMAKTRGRSVALWCVLGLFLGIFAIIILAVLGPAESQPEPVNPEDFN